MASQDKSKVGQYMDDFLGFVDQYHKWVIVVFILCLVTCVMLIIFGRKSVQVGDPALTIKWDDSDIPLDHTPGDAGPYIMQFNSLVTAITPSDSNRGPFLKYRVIRGKSEPSPRPVGKVIVKVIPLQPATSFTCFLVRRYEGYTQIVDLDPTSGKPTPVDVTTRREWTLAGYRQKEQLEIIAFVGSADKAQADKLDGIDRSKLIEVSMTPAR